LSTAFTIDGGDFDDAQDGGVMVNNEEVVVMGCDTVVGFSLVLGFGDDGGDESMDQIEDGDFSPP
jgi:hypothetical protein